jgi:hypothetical protein
MFSPCCLLNGRPDFHVTSVIILAVSACMFYRAIVVRRRFRRRLEEAIATGMLLPEQIVALQRREHVHLAEPTPKMWDVEYLKGAKGIDRWKEIMVRERNTSQIHSSQSHVIYLYDSLYQPRFCLVNPPRTPPRLSAALKRVGVVDSLVYSHLLQLPRSNQKT